MLRIRNPFYWIDTPKKTTLVVCYHCSKNFETHINNIRVYNYCLSCK
jgi:hypothetical protein